jgi:hypothetical protein
MVIPCFRSLMVRFIRFRACRSARSLVGSPKFIRRQVDFVIARSRGAEVVDVGRFCDTPRTHRESEASKVAGQEVCWQTRMRQSIKA